MKSIIIKYCCQDFFLKLTIIIFRSTCIIYRVRNAMTFFSKTTASPFMEAPYDTSIGISGLKNFKIREFKINCFKLSISFPYVFSNHRSESFSNSFW